MRSLQAWRGVVQAGVADAKALRQKQLGMFGDSRKTVRAGGEMRSGDQRCGHGGQ